MNQETKEALEKSIEKWRSILRGESSNLGYRDCHLCLKFHPYCGECSNELCPIYIKTGVRYCVDTPYIEFNRASKNGRVWDDYSRYYASQMLNFLISLREN